MIRILVLEDNKDDYEMVARAYEAAGMAVELTRVESQVFFREALEEQEWDILLLDYALPRFDGITALDMARKIRPEVPTIILSGVIEDELAVETLKIGARDYVAKDNLARLVPVTQRVLRVAAHKKELVRRFRSATSQLRKCVAELEECAGTGDIAYRLNGLTKAADDVEALANELVAQHP